MNQPPRDGCGLKKDYFGEADCIYAPPFTCEECMYGPRSPRGKNPQAAKYDLPVRLPSNSVGFLKQKP